ncbi:hypothetical protein C8R45DRAFT_944826 [Mycena sanguinolenta]|nr:hypothetical protein C8R45DRAFT_944826 [Mycena sanguinolenta]
MVLLVQISYESEFAKRWVLRKDKYTETFPNDRARLKALVWVMFFSETLFTVLVAVTALSMFGDGCENATFSLSAASPIIILNYVNQIFEQQVQFKGRTTLASPLIRPLQIQRNHIQLPTVQPLARWDYGLVSVQSYLCAVELISSSFSFASLSLFFGFSSLTSQPVFFPPSLQGNARRLSFALPLHIGDAFNSVPTFLRLFGQTRM